MIVVVDYGVGNISALLNMFDYLGVDAEASSEAAVIANAAKLALPGVGAFDKAMTTLRQRSLVAPLHEAVLERRVPILGICLGMQLLARGSEEGSEPGLGLLAADVRRIEAAPESALKIPHIGWSDVDPTGHSPLFKASATRERFYFVHGYHVCCDGTQDVAATIDYGGPLVCAVAHANIHGVQFHPEKSHRFGMRVLKSFADLEAA